MIHEHFQGDSFVVDGQLLDDAGSPIDLVAQGVTIRSQVRRSDFNNADAPLSELIVTMPTSTTFTLTAPTTANWPQDILVCNIRYVRAGVTFSTEEFNIRCMRSPTQ